MQVRDLLLQLTTYPVPTPDWAIEAAGAIAGLFDARVSGAVCKVKMPAVSNFLADALVHANEAIAAANKKSEDNAQNLLSRFRELVPPQHCGEELKIDCGAMVSSLDIAAQARVADMTIIPNYGHTGPIAEDLVFDSGRPVLLLPVSEGAPKPSFDHVVVGWDGGRAAARALADALPICARAASVKVVTITGDKALDRDIQDGLRRHLKAHAIEADLIERPAAGADAGSALLEFCRSSGAGLLVMGAYGHSQLREFILGGATRTVVAEADLPVLMAH